ncbi:hypothetical protein TNCV_4514071 [Trichonephila clavipes]|nr:hypothetical protein TNCV_4514071 [Trichonephila clavipes]
MQTILITGVPKILGHVPSMARVPLVRHSCPIPSLRPPLATLFYIEAKPVALVNSLATFLRLARFTHVIFSVVIGLGCSKRDSTDCEDSVVTIDKSCGAVIWQVIIRKKFVEGRLTQRTCRTRTLSGSRAGKHYYTYNFGSTILLLILFPIFALVTLFSSW